MVFLILSATITYLPTYVKNKIIEKLESKGYSVQVQECSMRWMGADCHEVHIFKENQDINFRSLNINYVYPEQYIIKANDGYVNYTHIQDNKNSYDSHRSVYELHLNNIRTNIKSHGYDVRLDIAEASYMNGEKYVKFTNASLVKGDNAFTIDKGAYEDGRISLGNISFELKHQDDRKIEPRDSKNKKEADMESYILKIYNQLESVPSFSFKSIKAKYNSYSINAISGDYKSHTMNCESIQISQHQEEITNMEGVNIEIKNNKMFLKSSYIYGSNEKLSKSNIKIRGVEIFLSKIDDTFDYDLKIGEVHISGILKKNGEDLEIKTVLDTTECQALIEALPDSMKDNLDEFIFAGQISGSTSLLTKNPQVSIKLNHNCHSVSSPKKYSRNVLMSKYSRIVINSKGEEIEEVTGPQTPNWVSLSNISQYMPISVMGTEDSAFMKHKGILINAIENSMVENIKAHKFIRGGSTISMQTAKNLWLNRKKTMARKIQEAFFTVHLEQILSKNEIMETYLNIVEFSPGEYGIGNAAKKYFNTNPASLSLTQCILLASLLPNPKSVSWDKIGRVTDSKMKFIHLVMNNLKKLKFITEEEEKNGLNEWVVIGQSEPDLIDEPEVPNPELQE